MTPRWAKACTAVWLLWAAGGTQALAAPASVARADSVYAHGQRDDARRLYSAALAENPAQSHALFRLAQLTEDHAQALQLYRRYVALEPEDPWGPMAAGDLLSRLGRTGEALAEYDRAAQLAPRSRDVVAGRARVLDRAGRHDEAAAIFERWIAVHPEDAGMWQELGRQSLKVGKPRRATEAFEQAVHTAPALASGRQPAAVPSLRLARALAAPSVQPLVMTSQDSDGDRTIGTGFAADLMIADGARLGARAMHREVSGGGASAGVDDAGLQFALRPRSTWRIDGGAGAVRFDVRGNPKPVVRWTGELRTRWRAPQNGPSLELRAQRNPLAATPELVGNLAVRDEGRLGLELPIGRLRLRGAMKGTLIETAIDRNWRRGAEGGMALQIVSAWTPWLRYEVGGYHDATTSGYFAPRRAEGITLGSTLELGEGAPWLLEFDGGAGLQRFAAQGTAMGVWRPGATAYAYASGSLGAGREVCLELEAEDSPGLSTAAAASTNWRYSSARLSLRWALR